MDKMKFSKNQKDVKPAEVTVKKLQAQVMCI